ncbi:MAG: type ISP restriction/modification enzyme [Pyrinomonadaceae bacterium]
MVEVGRGAGPGSRFDWRLAQWSLHVPVIRTLFEQVVTPSNMRGLGLEEVLAWTSDALNRVERAEFFRRFEEEHAVQYFYEPFLEAFDPELRKSLGVWYTPQEIVAYMVERVDRGLREELSLPRGLADERVYVLDPCCGTGAYLVETLRRIKRTVDEEGTDALSANDLKKAAMYRVFGFEILPAPFVVAHMQLGLVLQQAGVPLGGDERAGVYLTNALTGWEPRKEPKPVALFPELEEERDLAEDVKQTKPILVILGNPPYNGFAGVGVEEERVLSDAYRTTRRAPAPQGQGLNDLYVRFFRMAERRIVEQTQEGVVCFISNYSWLDGLSFTGMRERFMDAFDEIAVDCMNGDKYKTGKVTPEGKPDPSVFSTKFNAEGIQVGTAIVTLTRKRQHAEVEAIGFRHFWGKEKSAALLHSLTEEGKNGDAHAYKAITPSVEIGLPFMPLQFESDYFAWALLPELFPVSFPGVKTSRDDVVVDIDRERLVKRMEQYFDVNISHEEMRRIAPKAMESGARFNAGTVRDYLLKRGFLSQNIVRYCYRPFDVRWLYWEPETKLLDEKRSEYDSQSFDGNLCFVSQQKPRRDWSPPQVVSKIGCLDLMDRGATCFPLLLRQPPTPRADLLTSHEPNGEDTDAPRPNLSDRARDYLRDLGAPDAAASLFFHTVAVLHAPTYRTENAGALRQDFPRIPLPATLDRLRASAALGRQVAALLDTEQQVAGVTSGALRPELAVVGVLRHASGGNLNPASGDLEVRAGWGHKGKGGITMPGKGRTVRREYSETERAAFASVPPHHHADAVKDRLGGQTLDVSLNDVALWSGVPARVWEYTIGGYQVIKKWLSYREHEILGRGLTGEEAREVTRIARRIAALLLLEDELDLNYQNSKAKQR